MKLITVIALMIAGILAILVILSIITGYGSSTSEGLFSLIERAFNMIRST